MKKKKFLNLIGLLPILVVTFLFVSTPAFADSNQMVFASVSENSTLILEAPQGAVFDYVEFASYGTPDGLQKGWCDATESQQIVEDYILGNNYAEIPASNDIFGDPCGGTYKNLNVYAHYSYVEDPAYLNEPTNLSYIIKNDNLILSWDIPEDSGTPVERYAVFWSTDPENGWGMASMTNSITIPLSEIRSTGGSNNTYTFTIRSDNDTQSIYSVESDPIDVFISDRIYPSPSPTQTIQPTPTTSPEPTIEPSPSETTQITPSPSPSEPSLTTSPSPTPIFSKTPEPVVGPTLTPQPSASSPVVNPTPSEFPTPLDSPLPSNSATPENTPSINDTTDVKVQSILDNLVPGEAVTTGSLDALGLTYADLPPETPVSLPNGVVLTAKVADAIQIFNSPSAVVSAIFTDPGKALTAIANIGADMTPKVRKQSQKVVVASIIAAQVLSTTSVVGRVIKK
jgi:hypothetical protein